MRRSLLGLSVFVLACQARGGTHAPSSSDDAEPTAADMQPAVFAEIESLPREDQASPPPTLDPSDPGVELDWQAVDTSMSNLISQPRKRVDYDADHPYFGAAQPIVTAVVFADYQCPFCANADDLLQELIAAHPGDLRVVIRMMPLSFHTEARGAAMAALAAREQGQFEAMHTLLFAHSEALKRPELERYATELGLHPGQFQTDLDSEVLAERIMSDRALASALGVQGVPTIYLNGIEVDDLGALDQLILDELALAKMMMDGGAPRGEVWARIMAASEAP